MSKCSQLAPVLRRIFIPGLLFASLIGADALRAERPIGRIDGNIRTNEGAPSSLGLEEAQREVLYQFLKYKLEDPERAEAMVGRPCRE
jgi:hypothetical protein